MNGRKGLSYSAILALLAAALGAAVVASVTLGRYPIGIREMLGIWGSRVLDIEPFWTKTQESLLLNHRMPRILLSCMVGGCLSAAGASYQGVFQNPMAAPDILGASSGAACGAALAILLDMSSPMIMAFAFAFSLGTVALVIYTGNRARGKRVIGLILFVGPECGIMSIIHQKDPQGGAPASRSDNSYICHICYLFLLRKILFSLP